MWSTNVCSAIVVWQKVAPWLLPQLPDADRIDYLRFFAFQAGLIDCLSLRTVCLRLSAASCTSIFDVVGLFSIQKVMHLFSVDLKRLDDYCVYCGNCVGGFDDSEV